MNKLKIREFCAKHKNNVSHYARPASDMSPIG